MFGEYMDMIRDRLKKPPETTDLDSNVDLMRWISCFPGDEQTGRDRKFGRRRANELHSRFFCEEMLVQRHRNLVTCNSFPGKRFNP